MKERIHQELEVTDAVTAYGALAPYYKSISAARSPYLEAVEKIISTYVRGAGSLLDIGAGDATRTCIIAEAAGIQHVVAVEPSAAMRMRCEKKVHFWECKAAEIPETDLRFDVIICLWNVLGHIQTSEERRLALARAKRLLSPNGVMFVDVNHRYNAVVHGWCRTLWHMFRDYYSSSDTNGDVIVSWKIGKRPICTHGHLFTQRELKILFQSAGLIIKREWILNYRTGTVCKSALHGSLLYRLEAAADEAYAPAQRVAWGNTALAFRKR